MPSDDRPDLAQLLKERNEALLTTARGRMLRADSDRVVARREAIEAKIVAYLKARPRPVPVGDVVLHLTKDTAGFIELGKATGRPIYMETGAKGWECLLHDYGRSSGRQNCPEIVP